MFPDIMISLGAVGILVVVVERCSEVVGGIVIERLALQIAGTPFIAK